MKYFILGLALLTSLASYAQSVAFVMSPHGDNTERGSRVGMLNGDVSDFGHDGIRNIRLEFDDKGYLTVISLKSNEVECANMRPIPSIEGDATIYEGRTDWGDPMTYVVCSGTLAELETIIRKLYVTIPANDVKRVKLNYAELASWWSFKYQLDNHVTSLGLHNYYNMRSLGLNPSFDLFDCDMAHKWLDDYVNTGSKYAEGVYTKYFVKCMCQN